MNMTFSPASLFLVGVVPAFRDLEIARLLGWYRIPLRFAPKIIDVDFLAFYQTSAFGEFHRWKIEYISEVHGHELTIRSELFRDEIDHPRAKEEYYKIQIGPLMALPEPITAGKWKRLTFLYTTGEKVARAKTLQDLVASSAEREVLWRSLRERAIRSGEYITTELPEFPLDPMVLGMLGNVTGIKEIDDKAYREID